jgi:hypothetical protein
MLVLLVGKPPLGKVDDVLSSTMTLSATVVAPP